MLPLETEQETAAVILQLTDNHSLTLHIIMALFVQPCLNTVNACLKLSVKNSVETKLSNQKRRKEKIKKNEIIYMGFCTGQPKMKQHGGRS